MECPTPTAREAPPPSGAARRRIAAGWRRARRAHEGLGLSLETFTEDVWRLLVRSRVRLRLPLEGATLHGDLATLYVEDLYLARACEHGDDRAWETLVDRYEPDLRSVLRRNWDEAEAETVAAEVLADLTHAPADGRSGTRLGTYDGSGPLWAWLATIGFRTARRRWRKRRELPLDAQDERSAPALAAEHELDDHVARFLASLQSGWERLGTRERLAIGWKFRDGLPQRRIAALMGSSEPTVSRLVARGVAKLQGALGGMSEEGRPTDPALWTRIERALGAFLERSSGCPPQDLE